MSKEGSFFTEKKQISLLKEEKVINVQPDSIEGIREYRVSAIRTENFKAFKDSGWIKLNRITLLYGENSAGKSALYHLLKLLKFSYDKMRQEYYFVDTSGVEQIIGSFQSTCNSRAEEPYIRFWFQLKAVEQPYDEMQYCVELRKSDITEVGVVNRIMLRCEDKEYDLQQYYTSMNLFFLERKSDYRIPQDMERNVQELLKSIRSFAADMLNLSAHRYEPDRVMMLSGGRFDSVGKRGEATYQMLYSLSELEKKELPLVNEWLEKFGYTYKWNMIGDNKGEFELVNLKTKVASNIVDNGFGISQSLPLAVAIANLKDGMIVVDSPEAFLQTKMQSELADLLVAGAKKGYLLVETSSEYIMIRLRRRILEKKLDVREFSIYFVQDEQDMTRCEEIKLDDEGNFVNASKDFLDFFSSDYRDIVEMDELKVKRYISERDAEKDSD